MSEQLYQLIPEPVAPWEMEDNDDIISFYGKSEYYRLRPVTCDREALRRTVKEAHRIFGQLYNKHGGMVAALAIDKMAAALAATSCQSSKMSETLGQQAAALIWYDGLCTQGEKTPIAHIIDTLDAQRTPCCCEKLRTTLEKLDDLSWQHQPECNHCLFDDDNVDCSCGIRKQYRQFAAILKPALAQPCSCQRTEASAGSEEWTVEEKHKNTPECVFIVKDGAGKEQLVTSNALLPYSLTSAINAALRRSRVQPGAEQEERLSKAEKWLWVFVQAADGENLYAALQRQHGHEYETAYGWEKEAKERGLPTEEQPMTQPNTEPVAARDVEEIVCEARLKINNDVVLLSTNEYHAVSDIITEAIQSATSALQRELEQERLQLVEKLRDAELIRIDLEENRAALQRENAELKDLLNLSQAEVRTRLRDIQILKKECVDKCDEIRLLNEDIDVLKARFATAEATLFWKEQLMIRVREGTPIIFDSQIRYVRQDKASEGGKPA